MKDTKAKVDVLEVVGDDPVEKVLDSEGLTLNSLARTLREETEACVVKHVKVKGNVSATLDPRVRILAKAGPGLNLAAFGGQAPPDPLADEPQPGFTEPVLVEETLLIIEEVAHDIRLRAVIEAFKLRGAYINKGENSSDIVNINIVEFSDADFNNGADKPQPTQ